MAAQQQQALIEEPHRTRVWCRSPGCHRELTDPISRQRGVGPEHDPEPRTGHGRQHDVDQDTIPGL